MTSSTQCKDLNEFLAKHSTKNAAPGEGYTHTRIGDKNLSIFAGSYVIPQEVLPQFFSLYYDAVFVQKRKEYLTERQLEVGGPMAVDFDFRYDIEVHERQHDDGCIADMLQAYMNAVQQCYVIEPDKPFHVFIFEKPNVNRVLEGGVTKDGLHMIVGLQIDHAMQLVIRDKMLAELPNIWHKLPLKNSWESVLDEGISTGKTGWQVFGSRKPGAEAYELTHHYKLVVDPVDNEFVLSELDVSTFDLRRNFAMLSVRFTGNPKFEINPAMVDVYNQKFQSLRSPRIQRAPSNIRMNLLSRDDDNPGEEYVSLDQIDCKEQLDKAMNFVLSHLKETEYEIKETHLYTQALPAMYYQPGSHRENRQVAFALKHTDERLFLSWVMLRSKAEDFDYNSIPDLFAKWKRFPKQNLEGSRLTRMSIIYWVRKNNFEEYERIKQETVQHYLDLCCDSCTEYDVAIILKQMYKDKYVCVSYDNRGTWYRFHNHRWIADKGLSLRSKISEELYSLVEQKVAVISLQSFEYSEDDQRRQRLQDKMKKVAELSLRLKRTADKNNIMREAAEIFYDGEFSKNVDTNKYLMCFNNGVVDFANKVFREGYPEDYITKSTNINYIAPSDLHACSDADKYIAEIHDVMLKLFPVEDLREYMWNHLASSLIGTNKNQTFHVYHGSGSNGKSIIAKLMKNTLGDYNGTVPITLVCGERAKLGGTCDEVMKLKGIRFAMMQEPSKAMKLNEGVMKELTGGDPIQARGLYVESEIFEPQFNLAVCTNNLFDVDSNDDGTWRRIRKVDFMAKFVDANETFTDTSPYVYVKDKTLEDRLPIYAPYFASLLVQRAFITGGVVELCDTVKNASNKYRKGQDHIAAFVADRIIKTGSNQDRVSKREIFSMFKQWYEETQGSKKVPKGDELYDYLNKKFGEGKSSAYYGIQLKYPEQEDVPLQPP